MDIWYNSSVMKKKEWLILSIICIAALAMLAYFKLMPKKEPPADPHAEAVQPQEEAKGEWITVVWRNKIILYFDSGIDAEYEVEGDVGHMLIEVKDNSWHVKEVDCYDYTCKNMGWMTTDSILPIICLPNDLVIIDSDTAQNMIDEVNNGN